MKKPSLTETQHWMSSKIRPTSSRLASEVEVDLNPQGSGPGQDRLSVYSEGYEIRFREAVADVYEAVRWVIGQPLFNEIVKIYSRECPSRGYNLSFVGQNFAEFIDASPLVKEIPFLGDLAKLEWFICESFHAFDAVPVVPGDLSRIPFEELSRSTLIFQPSVHVQRSSWPILDIWSARKEARETADIELKNKPQNVMIFRRGIKVECRLTSDWQSDMLQSMLKGASLEAALESIVNEIDEDPDLISTWFSGLIQDGLIAQIKNQSTR